MTGKSAGRPIELTDAVKARICETLESGGTRTQAVHAGGVAYSTFLLWLARASEGEPFSSFCNEVKEAEVLGRQVRHDQAKQTIQDAIAGKLVKTVTKVTMGPDGLPTSTEVTTETMLPSFAASFRLLESQDAANYGRRQAIEHTGADGGPIQTRTHFDLGKLTEAQLQALLVLHGDGSDGGSTEQG